MTKTENQMETGNPKSGRWDALRGGEGPFGDVVPKHIYGTWFLPRLKRGLGLFKAFILRACYRCTAWRFLKLFLGIL